STLFFAVVNGSLALFLDSLAACGARPAQRGAQRYLHRRTDLRHAPAAGIGAGGVRLSADRVRHVLAGGAGGHGRQYNGWRDQLWHGLRRRESRGALSREAPLPSAHPRGWSLARLCHLLAAPPRPARPAVFVAPIDRRSTVRRGRLVEDAAHPQHHLYGHREVPTLRHNDRRITVVFPRQNLSRLNCHGLPCLRPYLGSPQHTGTPPSPARCLPRRPRSTRLPACVKFHTTTPPIRTARLS